MQPADGEACSAISAAGSRWRRTRKATAHRAFCEAQNAHTPRIEGAVTECRAPVCHPPRVIQAELPLTSEAVVERRRAVHDGTEEGANPLVAPLDVTAPQRLWLPPREAHSCRHCGVDCGGHGLLLQPDGAVSNARGRAGERG
jgi:hypothetical protein